MKELLIMGVFDRFSGGGSNEKRDEQGNTLEDYMEMLEEYMDAEAEILLNIAIIHFDDENITESIKNLRKAIEIYKELDNKEQEALVLDIMGDINKYRERTADALENYRDAYDLYTQIKSDNASDVKGKINELENVQYAESSQGKFSYTVEDKPSQTTMTKVVEPKIDVKEVKQKSNYSNISDNIEAVIGMLEGSDTYKAYAESENPLEELQKAYDMSSGIGDTAGKASLLLIMGDASLKQSNIDKALKYFKQALEYYQEIDNKTGEAVANLMIGTAYFLQGDMDSVSQSFRKSIEILRENKDLLGENIAMDLMNAIYEKE